jgi:hypothetical protein
MLGIQYLGFWPDPYRIRKIMQYNLLGMLGIQYLVFWPDPYRVGKIMQ